MEVDMKGKTIFQAAIIILLVTLVIILGSIPEKIAWAGADFQTVPTGSVTPTVTPTPPGGEVPWWQEYIGLICGISFLMFLIGLVVGGLVAWWITRGSKNLRPGSPTPGDGFEPPV
jgi:ABC-type cobalt transport system substrate-binding protein